MKEKSGCIECSKKLMCCGAKDGKEIDGKEFELETLQDLIHQIQAMINWNQFDQIHIKYFEGEDDLDLWVKIE